MLNPETGPLISVLIPCFNEEKVIVESVRRILGSAWPRLEILVLDDGSRDATSAVVREASRQRWGRDRSEVEAELGARTRQSGLDEKAARKGG